MIKFISHYIFSHLHHDMQIVCKFVSGIFDAAPNEKMNAGNLMKLLINKLKFELV